MASQSLGGSTAFNSVRDAQSRDELCRNVVNSSFAIDEMRRGEGQDRPFSSYTTHMLLHQTVIMALAMRVSWSFPLQLHRPVSQ